MHLSSYSDFALRVLIYLAVKRGEKASIQEVADAYGISQNHLVKVVHRLGKLGYVATTRGRGGGIRLAMAPDEITLGAVARATEPHFNLVECFEGATNKCPIAAACGLKHALFEGREAFFAVLDSYSIADIVKREQELKSALGLSEN